MKSIEIDIETFSSNDLSKCGVYKYVEAEDFEVLLFGYAVDGGDVQVVDLACGEKIPKEILDALTNDSIIKTAHNVMFERICLSKFLGYPSGEYLSPKSWRCTMVWAAYMGLPLSLVGVGAVLGLEEQKMSEGKSLIKYFCTPCNPTKANGGRTRNLPKHASEKWELFKAYNRRDVEVEINIQKKLKNFPVPDFVWNEFILDQKINDRGIALDMDLVNNAVKFDELTKTELTKTMKEITRLENPNSVIQMRDWLLENGLETDSLDKAAVKELLKTAPPKLAKVLELRQRLAKSSVKKYQAMQNAVCKDNRARGMFQFYGANRTGRFSGRLIQLQNLPKNYISDLKEAREIVRNGGFECMSMLYDDIPDVLSQLIRTAFIPKNEKKFIVADFAAIEARVIAWLAGEKWRLDVFENGGDIYCASASQMFGVPVEKNGVNGHLRQKGKIAELALGYGGSVGALKSMGAVDMGIPEDELKPIVEAWRKANPNITKLWWNVDSAVKKAVKDKASSEVRGIKFFYKSGMLFITLPSGRNLAYVKPRMGINKFGSESVTYEGVGATKKWERLESYGPKFVENIVQAISRDILMYAMKTLKEYAIVAHVHDEVIIEADKETSLETVCKLMGKTPPWAKGLLLRADGYECEFYKKD